NAFNHPPLKHLADHPIWARNPKFAMLPKEAEYAHERGWPAKPNAAVQLIQVNYVLPDMVAKAVNGMPTKRAMAWAEDQIKLAVQGKLREAGAEHGRRLPRAGGGRPGPARPPRAHPRVVGAGARLRLWAHPSRAAPDRLSR